RAARRRAASRRRRRGAEVVAGRLRPRASSTEERRVDHTAAAVAGARRGLGAARPVPPSVRSCDDERVSSEGITREELQLAARNHGMPLEVLRWPVTPVGMHYLLIHYDVPFVGDDWTLVVDGNVGASLTLTLEELRALPAHEVVATMECAGNGRARYTPRPLSQPWLDEAIGTGRWRGARLRDVLDRAVPGDSALEV